MNKTKIICTIGPASRDEDLLEQLAKAGMNVARLNFSHGTHEDHGENIARLKRVRERLGIPIAILLDTKGPEIRIGELEGGSAVLEEGQEYTFTTEELIGNKSIASVTYIDLPKDVSKGSTLLLDDGKLAFEVTDITDAEVRTNVTSGGELKERKGMNIPGTNLSMEYLSDADRSDILFGIEQDVDYIACSFVRSAEDVYIIRKLLDENGGAGIRIISKIENDQGIRNFEEILKASDGIMVARGDLGVEVAYETIPGLQKKFIRRCVQSGKIVITATQMLESMIESEVPTRAEVTDVAGAVFDGTAAVMLSGETASGMHPVDACAAMKRIVVQAEQDSRGFSGDRVWHEMDKSDTTNACAHACCTLAEDIGAGCIIAITSSGYTALRAAKFRPDIPIVAATPNEKVYNQMALSWGTVPIMTKASEDAEELIRICSEEVKKKGIAEEGSTCVASCGLPLNVSGNTNLIRVISI